MASPEFHALQAHLAAQPPPPPTTLTEQRARIDAALGGLPLAEGIEAELVDAGGVPGYWCRPVDGPDDGPVVVWFHGGGYRTASALAYRAFGSHLAKAAGGSLLMVDYRLAPEHPFPAAIDDAVAAYGWVLGRGVPPSRVVVGGDSAGGGLTAALLLSAAGCGLPGPAGAVCCSPWVDLRNEAASFATRAEVDKLFSKASADEAAGLYLQGADPTDPLVSPVLADWSGQPPLLIQVGDAEVLLDDAAALAEVARSAGVEVTHHVYDEMPHVWLLSYPAFPEAVAAVDEIAAFVQRVTGC